MPDAGSAIQPEEIAYLTCPRCWSLAPFTPYATLTFRCSRCEWPFTLAAPAVASPAVPATTVAAVNTTGTVVAVTITGGTLTFVYVNGAQAGTTAGTYLVPVSGSISITYSAAPTWAWALPAISAGVSAGGTALPFTAGGTSFSAGQVLIVDPAGAADVVVVTGTPAGTSVPVGGMDLAHLTGVLVTVATLTTALSGAGLENVPLTAY
jgi:uncharacterized protein (DUF983 family)